jgi:P2 family phage contractile tail tube protein
MTLPSKLKNMNLFNDGVSFLGTCPSVTLPKLGRNFEEYRAAGMDSPIKIDMGGTALEMEFTLGGIVGQVYDQFGATGANDVMLRFVGAYQNDQNGQVRAAEVVARGRHEEIDPGDSKPGEDTEMKVKSALGYYKLTLDGKVRVEIDVLNMVFMVNGRDRLAEQRKVLGVGGSLSSLVSPPGLNIPGIGGFKIPGL